MIEVSEQEVAGRYDLYIHQGSEFVEQWVFYEDYVAKTLFDFTDYEAELEIRDGYSGDVLASFSTDPADGLVISVASGSITFTIAKTETAILHVDQAVWDLKLLNPSTKPTYPMRGEVHVIPRVTR